MYRLLPLAVSAALASLACASPAPWVGFLFQAACLIMTRLVLSMLMGIRRTILLRSLTPSTTVIMEGQLCFLRIKNYWIATKLNPVIYDVTVEWRGLWTVRVVLNKFFS
jgi:hypothetical protein